MFSLRRAHNAPGAFGTPYPNRREAGCRLAPALDLRRPRLHGHRRRFHFAANAGHRLQRPRPPDRKRNRPAVFGVIFNPRGSGDYSATRRSCFAAWRACSVSRVYRLVSRRSLPAVRHSRFADRQPRFADRQPQFTDRHPLSLIGAPAYSKSYSSACFPGGTITRSAMRSPESSKSTNRPFSSSGESLTDSVITDAITYGPRRILK